MSSTAAEQLLTVEEWRFVMEGRCLTVFLLFPLPEDEVTQKRRGRHRTTFHLHLHLGREPELLDPGGLKPQQEKQRKQKHPSMSWTQLMERREMTSANGSLQWKNGCVLFLLCLLPVRLPFIMGSQEVRVKVARCLSGLSVAHFPTSR